jgi:acetoin utilization protein AcuB
MMLVGDVMQMKVVTITPKTTLPEALRLAQAHRIRHLPVLDTGELVGIVSDRDLKRAMASPATSLEAHELKYLLERLQVAEIMTKRVITTGPTSPLEEAARLMVIERISALPVMEAGQLVGIVTETDVLDLFLQAMGAGEPSTRLEVSIGGRPGAWTEVVKTIEMAGDALSSIVTLPGRDGGTIAVIRISTINPGAAIRALEAAGHAVRSVWPR